jgi:hypothetical protein
VSNVYRLADLIAQFHYIRCKHARDSQPVCIRGLCEWLADYETFTLMEYG